MRASLSGASGLRTIATVAQKAVVKFGSLGESKMLLSYAWMLIPIAVVFIIALFSNLIVVGNRFVNALVTALIAAVCLGLVAFGLQGGPPEYPTVIAAASAVFVADVIGNWINFSNRVASAMLTTLVFTILFVGGVYLMGLANVLAGA